VAVQPIPPRAGRPAPLDMRPDVSSALHEALVGWLGKYLGGNSPEHRERARLVAVALDLPVDPGSSLIFGRVLDHIDYGGGEELLDVVHATLGVLATDGITHRHPPYKEVDRLLAVGRSVWTAGPEGLLHRSDVTAQAAFERVTAARDSAAAELREAWRQAHSREDNAADAWDHSIRAVEYALIPIVAPKDKANLGSVIGQLKGQPHLWRFGVRGRGRDHGVEPLVGMLTLLWPDPNRHGSTTPEPAATVEEGRAIVNLATTIVQWARDGLITRR
jgi:hypothetical protein